MRLTVLGCHGGESPSHRLTTFLIDDNVVLDTGALTRSLELEEQYKIDHVLVSHTHLDHIGDLGFLADNAIGMRPNPINLYVTALTREVLEKHFFNNLVWPDFTRIKIPKTDLPVLRYVMYDAATPFSVGKYTVKATPMNHPVESMGMVFRWTEGGKSGALAYSSDTGPTEQFWTELQGEKDLKAVLCECSFPLEQQWLADVSGHLSPKTLKETVAKATLPQGVPILLYHGKPSHIAVLKQEIKALSDERMTMLKIYDRFEFV